MKGEIEMAKEQKEEKKQEKQVKPVNRGWILVCSVWVELLVFVVICAPLIWGLSEVKNGKLDISILGTLLGIILGIVGMTIVGFVLIYFWWAPNNLFFTFIREGTAKVVVRAHQFRKAFIQFKGFVIDGPKKTVNVVSVDEKHQENDKWYGGLRFYGFWPVWDIFTYKFEWIGVKENGEFDPHPKETLDYIILKDDVYGCRVEKAEDEELMPLDIKLTLTVRIINPYKALFVVENWYETMMNRVRPYVRDFVTTDTYAKFIKDNLRIGEGITKRLEKEGILNELLDRYGIDIRKIEVNAIDPVEEFRKVVMAKVLALREKDRIITEAGAEKQKLEIVAEGEANRIKRVYEEIERYGGLGKLIRLLEAIEKSPGQGAKWIIPLPGMAEFFSQVFPGQTTESLSPDKLRQIKEIVGQLRNVKPSPDRDG